MKKNYDLVNAIGFILIIIFMVINEVILKGLESSLIKLLLGIFIFFIGIGLFILNLKEYFKSKSN